MVFKAVTGVDKRVFDTWNSPHTSSEDVMAALDVINKHPDHYKNRIVLNWGEFGPSEVNRWFSRGVIQFQNPKLKSHNIFFYPHQA